MTGPRKGDHVEWNASGRKVRGTVVDKVTREVHVKGHAAKASANEPQFRVRSDKTGKEAVHKPSALRKTSAARPRAGAHETGSKRVPGRKPSR